jgi:hypothetical protein
MTKMVSLGSGRPEYLWFATSGLFDWVADFLRARVHDPAIREEMYADAVSGYLFIDKLPDPPRGDLLRALREELIPAVDTELYPPPLDEHNNEHLFAERAKNLAKMAWRLAREEAGDDAPTIIVSDEYQAAVSPESIRRVADLLGVPDDGSGRLDLRALPGSALRALRDDAEAALGDGDGRVLAQMAGEALASS